MKQGRLWLILFALVLITGMDGTAQKPKAKKPVQKSSPQQKPVTKKPPTTVQPKVQSKVEPPAATPTSAGIENSDAKVKDIVNFLQYVLNTLGSSKTSTRDKEVLVTDSYIKIFRDAKVQVEDDLDEGRTVVTNKDVTAYLKDIDFFFKDVTFEFNIESIEKGGTSDQKVFYKVGGTRNLKGTTTDGKAMNNSTPRFIEINYDTRTQDLKIVSIYSKGFDEKVAMTDWWNNLSFEWQSVFKKKLNFASDSLTTGDMISIVVVDSLDLSNNTFVLNLEPLTQLRRLQSLRLGKTMVADLTPIRNLTELKELDISGTSVKNLSALRYAARLRRLDISHTPVSDLNVIEKLDSLEYLEAAGTGITDLAPLSGMDRFTYLGFGGTGISNLTPLAAATKLIEADLSGTSVTDLSAIAGWKDLTVLRLDSTKVLDLRPLSGLKNLKVLHINHTPVSTLQPLQGLPALEKVYCDQTPVDRTIADTFMAANPKTLIIFDSKDLKTWWESLDPAWQEVLTRAAGSGNQPTKDELARVTNLDSINLYGKLRIKDLDPLARMPRLRTVLLANTGIENLEGLKGHKEINYLDFSATEVADVSPILGFTKLKILKADKTKISDVGPLSKIASLEIVYVDDSGIHDLHVREFMEKNNKCLVVYKTFHVNRWWARLPDAWKKIFTDQFALIGEPTREDLHQLVERRKIAFKDSPVTDLLPLGEFVRLEEIHFSGTGVTDLSPLSSMRSLRSLHASSGAIRKLEPISQLTGLVDLDISNTPVDELKPLVTLTQLKTFNVSGTQIKKLDPLANLNSLEALDCSNTAVSKLGSLGRLRLKTLKCYNTKVSKRELEQFRQRNPECNVVYYR